jgi:hypothetical protein
VQSVYWYMHAHQVVSLRSTIRTAYIDNDGQPWSMIMGSATCHVAWSSCIWANSCLSYRSVPHPKLPSLALSTLFSTSTADLSLIVVLCIDSLSRLQSTSSARYTQWSHLVLRPTRQAHLERLLNLDKPSAPPKRNHPFLGGPPRP